MFTPVDRDGAGLTIPIFATMTHALAGFIAAFSCQLFPSFYIPKPIQGTKQWLQVMSMSVFFACTIGLNNSSLVYLPLSIQQTVRACSPVAIAVAAYFIEDKMYSIKQVSALVLLVSGIVLTVVSNDSANLIGVLLAGGSVISGALYYSCISLHLSAGGANLNPIDILLYTSLPVALILFPAFIFADEYTVIGQFSEDNGILMTVGLLLIGCMFAVSYNLMTFKFIAMLSAVYLSVVANFKLVLLIVLGVVMFGEEVTWLNALGLTIATVAFSFYSYFEYEIRVAKDLEKANAAAAAKSASVVKGV
jgi:solute carrier family 35 protein E3